MFRKLAIAVVLTTAPLPAFADGRDAVIGRPILLLQP